MQGVHACGVVSGEPGIGRRDTRWKRTVDDLCCGLVLRQNVGLRKRNSVWSQVKSLKRSSGPHKHYYWDYDHRELQKNRQASTADSDREKSQPRCCDLTGILTLLRSSSLSDPASEAVSDMITAINAPALTPYVKLAISCNYGEDGTCNCN